MSINKVGPIFLTIFILASCAAPAEVVSIESTYSEQIPSPSISPLQMNNSPSPTDSIWHPAIRTRWQWQLTDLPADTYVDAQVFDIDLFENDAEVVSGLHAMGRRVICYLNAGSWENWRPDKALFPSSVIGKNYEGWPDEKWLDIRQIDMLSPIIRARLDLCKQKGFDAVEPDNIDGFTNNTGFPLTSIDQLRYNKWLAVEAHKKGLSIGLKNDPEQAAELEPFFDWAMTEDCFFEGWCDKVSVFIKNNKAVFAAEYTDTGMTLDKFCPAARKLGFSAILKNRELDDYRSSCP
jgi:hypothetical protein